MTLDRIFPARVLDLPHDGSVADGNARITQALADEGAIPLARWRVRGNAEGYAVHLWYSLRRKPLSLAPHLRARWHADGTAGARLVGEFRQERRMARLVFWTGVAFALGLVWLAAQGGLAIYWTMAGIAFFVGYPWLAWFMHENHVEKIEALLRRALAV